MKRPAVWVCPDCGKRLEAPGVHACPHERPCIPGLCGGPPSELRDECDECARRVLFVNFTKEPSGWAQRRREEDRAAMLARNAAREASREAAAANKAAREERAVTERAAREEARKNMAENARALLETLKKRG